MKENRRMEDGEGEQNLLNAAANAPVEALGAIAGGAPFEAVEAGINAINENKVEDSPLAGLPNNVSAADTWAEKFGKDY